MLKNCWLIALLVVFPVTDTYGWQTLDQFTGSGATNGAGAIYSSVEWSQTFTVGIEGELSIVELLLDVENEQVAEPIVVDIRTLAGGLPSGTILGSVSIGPESLTQSLDWITFDFSDEDIFVQTDEQLAIVARSIDPIVGAYGWAQTGPFQGDLYSRGSQFRRIPPGEWQAGSFSDSDFYFRTYVSTNSVPEPGSGAALMALAFAVLLRRSKGRAR